VKRINPPTQRQRITREDEIRGGNPVRRWPWRRRASDPVKEPSNRHIPSRDRTRDGKDDILDLPLLQLPFKTVFRIAEEKMARESADMTATAHSMPEP